MCHNSGELSGRVVRDLEGALDRQDSVRDTSGRCGYVFLRYQWVASSETVVANEPVPRTVHVTQRESIFS
jgi:hypothetical protein